MCEDWVTFISLANFFSPSKTAYLPSTQKSTYDKFIMSTPALFDWLKQREAGIILHPTALPGSTGIGSFDRWAYRWIDFLAQAGMRYWQVLPLGPTSYGDSPYQSFSTFAGNPYLIDLDILKKAHLISERDLEPLLNRGATKVDFGMQYHQRLEILRTAFANYQKAPHFDDYGSFDQFCDKHTSWLAPYALFMALKDIHGGVPWWRWPETLQRYDSAKNSSEAKNLKDKQRCIMFWQYLFWGQWQKLKGYGASRGVKIIGDIPIFVAIDSADVWANPELFMLGNDGRPAYIAGVPPDYFSATGQRWGNPLYEWPMHQKSRYRWWLKRLGHMMELYDVVRIDHFRGFYDFWKIPANSPDAVTGQWVRGPDMDLFNAVSGRYPNAPLIAEDLGELHDGVRNFLKQTGLPGMAIFQFGFGGDPSNAYLPHNLVENSIYYSGTHDNDTLQGWFDSSPEHVRNHVLGYLGCGEDKFLEQSLRFIWESVANLAIVPAQDLLGISSDGRFNTPGTLGENWSWRMTEEMFERICASADTLREQLKLYGRAQ